MGGWHQPELEAPSEVRSIAYQPKPVRSILGRGNLL